MKHIKLMQQKRERKFYEQKFVGAEAKRASDSELFARSLAYIVVCGATIADAN